MEHQKLGRRFICPIVPATEREFILDWRISWLYDKQDNFKPQTFWIEFWQYCRWIFVYIIYLFTLTIYIIIADICKQFLAFQMEISILVHCAVPPESEELCLDTRETRIRSKHTLLINHINWNAYRVFFICNGCFKWVYVGLIYTRNKLLIWHTK